MESESTAPPAKKLCTEDTAVSKSPEANSLDKSSKVDCVSEPVPRGKNVGSENETGQTEEQVASGNGTVPEDKTPTPASETVDEGNAESQKRANGDPKTKKMQTAPAQPSKEAKNRTQVDNSKADTGKVPSQTQKGGKQNGLEPSDRLPPAAKPIDHVDLSRVIEGIQVCDYDIEKMTISANQKVVEIERALRDSKKPVYSKRSNLIQHIPEFWLTTLINHHHISHFINEADEDCLQYLRRLHVEEFDESVSGFKISFVFEANPYFENEVLCKEISYSVSGVLRSKATPIRWKPGHDLTRVTEASASSSKSMPQSFFHWFLQNSNPVQDKVAVFIRDDIWPNPLKYFQVHTEDSSIDVSSDGIIVDSSGDEDDDVMVLEDSRDADFDDLDDEDIELLENEEELLDEDEFDSEEEELLMEDEEDDFDDDELMLIESRGPPPRGHSHPGDQPPPRQQKGPVKKTVPLARVGPSKAPPAKGTPVPSKAPPGTLSSKAPPTSAKAQATSSNKALPTAAPRDASTISKAAAPSKETSDSQETRRTESSAVEKSRVQDDTAISSTQGPPDRDGQGVGESVATGEGTEVNNKDTADETRLEGTGKEDTDGEGTAQKTGTAEHTSAVTVKS